MNTTGRPASPKCSRFPLNRRPSRPQHRTVNTTGRPASPKCSQLGMAVILCRRPVAKSAGRHRRPLPHWRHGVRRRRFACDRVGEALPAHARCGGHRSDGRRRRTGRPARPERGGQDDNAHDAPRRDPPGRGKRGDRAPSPPRPAQPGPGRGGLRCRVPAAAGTLARSRVPHPVREALRPRRPQGGHRCRLGPLRHHPSGRQHGQRAVVGPADPRRDREGHPAPPPVAHLGRAHRVARPRRRPKGPDRSRPDVLRGQHRPPRHQPQYDRGGTPLRARGLPVGRAGGRRWQRGRGGGPVRAR